MKEPGINSTAKQIIHYRIVNELKEVLASVNEQMGMNATELGEAAFSEKKKSIYNWTAPNINRWSSPSLAQLYELNDWLAKNDCRLVDIQYVFHGREHPYNRIINELKQAGIALPV